MAIYFSMMNDFMGAIQSFISCCMMYVTMWTVEFSWRKPAILHIKVKNEDNTKKTFYSRKQNYDSVMTTDKAEKNCEKTIFLKNGDSLKKWLISKSDYEMNSLEDGDFLRKRTSPKDDQENNAFLMKNGDSLKKWLRSTKGDKDSDTPEESKIYSQNRDNKMEVCLYNSKTLQLMDETLTRRVNILKELITKEVNDRLDKMHEMMTSNLANIAKISSTLPNRGGM